eukprot:g81562.t1
MCRSGLSHYGANSEIRTALGHKQATTAALKQRNAFFLIHKRFALPGCRLSNRKTCPKKRERDQRCKNLEEKKSVCVKRSKYLPYFRSSLEIHTPETTRHWWSHEMPKMTQKAYKTGLCPACFFQPKFRINLRPLLYGRPDFLNVAPSLWRKRRLQGIVTAHAFINVAETYLAGVISLVPPPPPLRNAPDMRPSPLHTIRLVTSRKEQVLWNKSSLKLVFHSSGFDLFIINQHDTDNVPGAFWFVAFEANVKRIGHTVLILCTSRTKSTFEIILPPKEEQSLLESLVTVFESINTMLATVDVANSKAWKLEDQMKILEAVGAHTLNKVVVEQLHEWLAKTAKAAIPEEFSSNDPLSLIRGVADLLRDGGSRAAVPPLTDNQTDPALPAATQ